jgi:hypothetical protein
MITRGGSGVRARGGTRFIAAGPVAGGFTHPDVSRTVGNVTSQVATEPVAPGDPLAGRHVLEPRPRRLFGLGERLCAAPAPALCGVRTSRDERGQLRPVGGVIAQQIAHRDGGDARTGVRGPEGPRQCLFPDVPRGDGNPETSLSDSDQRQGQESTRSPRSGGRPAAWFRVHQVTGSSRTLKTVESSINESSSTGTASRSVGTRVARAGSAICS